MEFIYKGLEAELRRHEVTDEEVRQQLDRIRQQRPKVTVITDRAAEKGDELLLDYAGFCDGEQFAGGTAEQQTLVLGSGTFIPGFEDQLIGSKPGDKVSVKVTFPQQYHAPNLAGKEAEFRCTVHEIRQTSIPEVDDEFAQSLGLKNVEHLLEDLRQSIQHYADKRSEMELQDLLIRQAAASYQYTPIEAQVSAVIDEQLDSMRAQLAQQGITLEKYCQLTRQTEQQLREQMKPEAQQILHVRATLEHIVKLENLTLTEAEQEAVLKDICSQNKITMEQFNAAFDEHHKQAFFRNAEMQKAMQLVRNAATVKEVSDKK